MNRSRASFLTAAMALLIVAPDVLAHPGHGDPEGWGSLLHYMVEPVHIPVLLVLSVILIMVSGRVSRRLLREARKHRR